MSTESHEKSSRIYLLPNLFTTAGLFAGFYAVVSAMNGHFGLAAFSIFIAMIADGLDGRVARLTNTESAFGAQYDSISDMLAFGVAPALVVYSWGLSYLGKLGWLAAFIYTASTGLRLARFNTQLDHQNLKYFQGLPCPAAAGLIAGTVWFCYVNGFNGVIVHTIVGILTLLVGLLMVSNFHYYSFKEFDLKGNVPFVFILAVVIVYVVISIDPPSILFSAFLLYALSGLVSSCFWWWRGDN